MLENRIFKIFGKRYLAPAKSKIFFNKQGKNLNFSGRYSFASIIKLSHQNQEYIMMLNDAVLETLLKDT